MGWVMLCPREMTIGVLRFLPESHRNSAPNHKQTLGQTPGQTLSKTLPCVGKPLGKPLGKPWANPGQTPALLGQTPGVGVSEGSKTIAKNRVPDYLGLPGDPTE